MRILLVEDDAIIGSGIRAGLTRLNFSMDWFRDGQEGLDALSAAPYDAVVLDLSLPGLDGLDILRRWRRRGLDVPVLILTARDALHQRLAGFHNGADDYLGKPFALEELAARLQALIRRRHGRTAACLVHGGLSLDTASRRLFRDGEEISLPPRALKFFVDDNFTADPAATKELLRAMIPLRCRWVTQMSIHAAHDEELLDLLHRAGCVGVLVGFESLEVETLRRMGKTFNSMRGGYEVALDNLRRHRIAVYATFVFGYDSDKPQVFEEVFDFAMRQEFYVAAFNHLIPFPGTPLHARLEQEGRLFSSAWWLDPAYRFGMVPFAPLNISAHELTEKCQDLRRRFYSLRRILARCNRWNCGGGYLGRNFLPVNLLQRFEVGRRTGFPLGREGRTEPLLCVNGEREEFHTPARSGWEGGGGAAGV